MAADRPRNTTIAGMPRPRARLEDVALVFFWSFFDWRSPSSSLSTSDRGTGLHSSRPWSSGLFVAFLSMRGSHPAATTAMPGKNIPARRASSRAMPIAKSPPERRSREA